MARGFKLINNIGEEIDLNSESFFAYNPENLGIHFENTYYGANANFKIDSTAINQQQLTIELLFNGKFPYLQYNEFIHFLNYQPLTLYYSVPNVATYHRECIFSALTKSELTDLSVLQESITLDFTTPWYQWVEYTKSHKVESIKDAKIYDYIYGYNYWYDGSDMTDYISLNNDSIYLGSSFASPLEIEITAKERIENPHWSILVDGEVVQTDRYFIDLEEGEKIVVSSVPQNQKAVKILTNDEEMNIYQYQDMTKTNFVTAPVGLSTIDFDGLTDGIKVKLRKEWLMV